MLTLRFSVFLSLSLSRLSIRRMLREIRVRFNIGRDKAAILFSFSLVTRS